MSHRTGLEHKSTWYEHPEGEYVKYEEYSRVLKELNNLKFGKTCLSIAKKTDSKPEDVKAFAQEIKNEVLANKNAEVLDQISSGKNNKIDLIDKKKIFLFKDKKVSGLEISNILLKR